MNLQKLIKNLKARDNFVITSHVNMEGDALGSELAMYLLLKALGKKAVVVNDDKVSFEYSFMPLSNTIVRYRAAHKRLPCDCLVALDCADLGRCGRVASLIRKGVTTVFNIDHHISNVRFGDVNWVEPEVSSASEMVYRLYKYLGIPFTPAIATLLYAGMMTDTGSFHYSNTTCKTHQAAGDLMQYGIDVTCVYRQVYENISFGDMKVLNSIKNKMQFALGGRLAWVSVSRNVQIRKSSFDFSEHLLSFMRAVRNVQVAVLFRDVLKEKNKVRVNFRSQGAVDVSKIAASFGGGGHRAASGTTIEGSLEPIKKKVLAKVRQAIRAGA